MRRLNNLRLERINSSVFKHERERLIDFGNMRHADFYAKWKVAITALESTTDVVVEALQRNFFGNANPLKFASHNQVFLKQLQTSIHGEFLFTYHKHWASPYKEYDLRGILFDTAEHKALFILKNGDIMGE
jgi:hypothetical protein